MFENSPFAFRCMNIVIAIASLLCTSVSDASASVIPGQSDIIGVRQISDPNAMVVDATGLVEDVAIRESADGFDLGSAGGVPLNTLTVELFYIAVPGHPNQVAVNNQSIINLGVTGYAYLLEPGTKEPSDRISIVAHQTVGAQNRVTFTITLDSDPFNDNVLNNHSGFPENGLFQFVDIMFNRATDPGNPGMTVSDNNRIPFHVVVASDVPEPASLLLLMGGIVALVSARRRSTCSHRRRSGMLA